MFVEIRVKAGKVKEVIAELRRMRDDVQQVCAVTGHCDLLATVTLPNMESLSKFLFERIQILDGIVHTESLVCISNEESR